MSDSAPGTSTEGLPLTGPPIEPLLTMEEVATLYRVSVKTVRQWRDQGLPPHGFRVGKHVRYHPSAVREDMERRRAQEAPGTAAGALTAAS